MGDLDWEFVLKDNGVATIPLAFQVGGVTKIGDQTFNSALEGADYIAKHGPAPIDSQS